MNHPRLTRRRLLGGTAGIALAALAGCIGSPSAAEQPTVEGESPTVDGQSGGDDQPGHGQEAHGHDTASEPKSSREVAVNTARSGNSTEYHFDPHVTWVEVGGTITWRLESGTHTATAYHPGNDQPRLVPEETEAWDSGTMSEVGETFSHTFDTEGVYHYLCKPHEAFGMIATVIVGEPHLDDQQALQMMPENKPEEVHGKLEELNTMVREVMGQGHHEESTNTEENHHEEQDGTTTEDGHHEEEDGHQEESTATEEDHSEGDGHHEEETTTEGDHHEEGDGHHDESTTEEQHPEGETHTEA